MVLEKPRFDYDYEDKAKGLQYKHVQGTLAHQIAAFKNKGGHGSFSWLTAPAVTKMVVDNPDFEFRKDWYRTGTGVDYAHENGGAVNVYFSPQNRILLSGKAKFEVPLNGKALEQLAADAKRTESGVLVVDLDTLSKNKAWNSDSKEHGHLVVSTVDYERQMNDDPAVAVLVSAGYSPKGEALNRVMHYIRQRRNETWTFALQPDYVRKTATEGTGLGRLSAVVNSYYDSVFSANHYFIDNDGAFAFGVRQTAEGGAPENKQ